MIIVAQTNKEIDEVKMTLKSAFKMKELGEVKFILGIEIDHDRVDDQADALHRRCHKLVQPTGCEVGGEPVRVRHEVDEDAVVNNEYGARGHDDQALQVAGRVLFVHHDLHAPGRGIHRHAAVAVLGEPRGAAYDDRHTRALLPEDHEGLRDRLQRQRRQGRVEGVHGRRLGQKPRRPPLGGGDHNHDRQRPGRLQVEVPVCGAELGGGGVHGVELVRATGTVDPRDDSRTSVVSKSE
ncbi:unnamed protein product [Phytophthora fragariaefolia]|uniref:Unnamed protein product n=1 Tax=Phytophthora fragariaefolia TaxID=1490495 RepID=A0A9W6XZN6_9STRA|nr:unnamed protein product [Phytophthora fragariaefolia]